MGCAKDHTPAITAIRTVGNLFVVFTMVVAFTAFAAAPALNFEMYLINQHSPDTFQLKKSFLNWGNPD
jgi:hypothetical protein